MIQGLLSVEVDPFLGPKQIEKILMDLSHIIDIEKTSAISKVKTSEEVSDLIYVVIRFSSQEGGSGLVEKIVEIEKKIAEANPQRSVQVTVLASGNLISVMPQVLLPHPRLVTKSHILRAAQEVYPNYQHPVLNKMLKECPQMSIPDVEFVGLTKIKK